MRRILTIAAILAIAAPTFAVVDSFKVTIDGSFSIEDSEGYANAGSQPTVRLDKWNQHIGYMDWAGAVGTTTPQSMAAFVAAHGGTIFKANLYIKSVSGLYNAAGIVTIRAGNTGDIVEDTIGGCCANYDGLLGANATDIAAIGGRTEAHAWRSADPYILNPARFGNLGEGLDKLGAATMAGEAWQRPSTGLPGPDGFQPTTSTTLFLPLDLVRWKVFTKYRGWTSFGEQWSIEAVLGMSDSASSNTVARFEGCGQLVNKDQFGEFRMINETPLADGWYKVQISPEIVDDIINNPENKGIAFSSFISGGGIDWSHNGGNDTTYTRESGSASTPYLEIDARLAADVSDDGSVDVVDLLFFVDAFGSVYGDANFNADCDFNYDYGIDVVDLLILVENFGNSL